MVFLGIGRAGLEPDPAPPTVQHVAEWLRLLVPPGTVAELRAIHCTRPGRTFAGFFAADRLDRMARLALMFSRDSRGVYFTANPVDPSLGAADPGRVDRAPEARGDARLTTDRDVVSRSYAVVDVDPVRAEGHAGQSATDAERGEAWAVASRLVACTSAAGWPSPLVIDSGNGLHLYYRVTAGSAAHRLDLVGDRPDCPVRWLLRRLASAFDTPGATIDPTVGNPGRVFRVPGSFARKGTPTADRPHRCARVVSVPDDWEPGTRAGPPLADLDIPHPPADPLPTAAAYTGPASADVLGRVVKYLAALPVSVQGSRGSAALMTAARAIVWGFDLGVEAGLSIVSEVFNPKCLPPWSEGELRRACERAMRDPKKPRGWLLSGGVR